MSAFRRRRHTHEAVVRDPPGKEPARDWAVTVHRALWCWRSSGVQRVDHGVGRSGVGDGLRPVLRRSCWWRAMLQAGASVGRTG